jgi:crotonobetainyl-CoA:carnitine CoA-transferase CaiB-like acyl-CoA transferase
MLLGDPSLVEHELFQDARLRQQRAAEFDQLFLLPYLKEHTKKEIFEQAQELRMPFGYAQTIDELLEDVQLQAREFFVKAEHPVMGDVTYPGPLFRMGETPWKVGRAPLLGEHNKEFYCQRLGYTREDLVKLRERGII